jgi:hypothetical protein
MANTHIYTLKVTDFGAFGDLPDPNLNPLPYGSTSLDLRFVVDEGTGEKHLFLEFMLRVTAGKLMQHFAQKKSTEPNCIQFDWSLTNLDIYECFPIEDEKMKIIYRDQLHQVRSQYVALGVMRYPPTSMDKIHTYSQDNDIDVYSFSHSES